MQWSKNLAIIGASYFQLPLIQKAKEMGYITHVFAWAANDVGETAADRFYPISITEKERIAKKCAEIGICGICSIGSDLAVITVNYVAEQLGLIGNTGECTRRSTNKHLMRIAFAENGDPSPKSLLVDAHMDIRNLKLTYPVIVKPTDRSGSRGICKVDKQGALTDAINEAIEVSFEKKALIEEFVEGQEYSVEGISYHGEHRILAFTQKYTTGAPHYIETKHVQPAEISESLRKMAEKVVVHALDTLQIENGASHTEIKVTPDGQIKIIEIGSRMGGDCIGSDLVFYSTGIDYVKAVIQVACGEEPDMKQEGECHSAEVRFIFGENDLIEFERMKRQEQGRILRIVDDKHLYLTGLR